ncbi:hypothetical protein [Streptomyces sp. NK15101]|uniref:hypothetical protein n=1 Tax=Streptomyces sp. NK15101 TaxID=2873261 RepID=UPI001CED2C69|nr:hypothetical protein [Streptomyces sp. NK15101]
MKPTPTLRTIEPAFLVPGPSGVAIRTRLKGLGPTDEKVLRQVGAHLGSLASRDLKIRWPPPRRTRLPVASVWCAAENGSPAHGTTLRPPVTTLPPWPSEDAPKDTRCVPPGSGENAGHQNAQHRSGVRLSTSPGNWQQDPLPLSLQERCHRS